MLESANLVSTVRHGRRKLHYLNPVPLHQIQHRWIQAFEYSRLDALHALKHQAEEAEMAGTAEKPTFVYVTFIQSSPEKVWEALTDADLTAQYWGHSNVSDWQPGSRWEHVRTDGSGIADVVGEVIEAAPPRRLVMTFGGAGRLRPAVRRAVRYRTAQRHRPADGDPRRPPQRVGLRGRLGGLGSGHLEPEVAAGNRSVLPQAPWEMHAELRAERMSRQRG